VPWSPKRGRAAVLLPPCRHGWGVARCSLRFFILGLGLESREWEERVEVVIVTGDDAPSRSPLAGVVRSAAVAVMSNRVHHRSFGGYQEVRESVGSVVVRVAPPGASPPAITAGGTQSGRGWGRLAFRPVRSKREGDGEWAVAWLWAGPEGRREPVLPFLFSKIIIKW
jgi:hypothetical protein